MQLNLNKSRIPIISLAIITISIITFYSCNSRKDSGIDKTIFLVETDTSSLILKYNNSLFSVPSPYQAAIFIHKNGISFNQEILNNIEKITNYTTNFDKALNVGIYGTDLVYLNMYNQTQGILSYFSIIKKLSEDLDLINIADYTVFKEIENNLDDSDSLLQIISKAYVNSNHYLKINERSKTSALIVAGGWLESLYILTQSIPKKNNTELIKRVAEQKNPLNNVIELLSPFYYESEDFTKLINSFIDLKYEFNRIIFNYSYQEPTIHADKKLTVINGKSKVVISNYQLRTITNKIACIRDAMTQ